MPVLPVAPDTLTTAVKVNGLKRCPSAGSGPPMVSQPVLTVLVSLVMYGPTAPKLSFAQARYATVPQSSLMLSVWVRLLASANCVHAPPSTLRS